MGFRVFQQEPGVSHPPGLPSLLPFSSASLVTGIWAWFIYLTCSGHAHLCCCFSGSTEGCVASSWGSTLVSLGLTLSLYLNDIKLLHGASVCTDCCHSLKCFPFLLTDPCLQGLHSGFCYDLSESPKRFQVLKFNSYCEVLRGWKLNPTMVFRGGVSGE